LLVGLVKNLCCFTHWADHGGGAGGGGGHGVGEWARGEADRNRNTCSRSHCEGESSRALKASKASCAYEPKAIRLFWDLIGKCAGLPMRKRRRKKSGYKRPETVLTEIGMNAMGSLGPLQAAYTLK
jgi:hypothetical protein